MLRTVFLVALVITSVIAIGTAPATGDSDWPDRCRDAPVITEGSHSGTVEAGGDQDTFKIRLDRGNYIDMKITLSEKSQLPDVDIRPASDGSEVEIRGEENTGVENSPHGDVINLHPTPGETASFELWAKQDLDEPLCFRIHDVDWETRHDWEMEFNRAHPDVTLYEVRQLEEEVADLREQINELEGASDEEEQQITALEDELDEKNERINELESELTEKDQRLEELEAELEVKEQRIEELEEQDDTDEEVVIDVTVEPEGERNAFISGDAAAISVDSAPVDPTAVTLAYRGETYTPDSSGELSIPLSGTGEQELTLRHGDTEETATITVLSADETDAQAADEGDTTPSSDTDVSGFGSGVALLGVVLFVLTAARRYDT